MVTKMNKDEKIEKVLSNTQDEPSQIDHIAEIRGWFRSETDSPYFSTVQSYLRGKFSLDETISTITSPIDEAISSEKLSSINWLDLWYSIFHCAKRNSYLDTSAHAKLVELVRMIKDHSDTSSKSVYKDLPGFGMAKSEAYNDNPIGYTAPEISAWTNFNYFLALLTSSSVVDISLYAIWALRAALETKHIDEPARGAIKAISASQKYDANVPAATMWVFALGKRLYEKKEDLTPTDPNEGNPARGGDLWKGGPEFSKTRWALWKARFGEVAGMDGVGDKTKKLAREAVDAMEKAENE